MFQIGKRQAKLGVQYHLPESFAQTRNRLRVVAAVGWWIGIQIIGRDGGADKDIVVIEIVAMQNSASDRVIKTFGTLGLLVLNQQGDKMKFDLQPDIVVQRLGLEFFSQTFNRFFNPQVVKQNTVTRGIMNSTPVSQFKAVFGNLRGFAKQPVVPVKAPQYYLSDSVCGAFQACQVGLFDLGSFAQLVLEIGQFTLLNLLANLRLNLFKRRNLTLA